MNLLISPPPLERLAIGFAYAGGAALIFIVATTLVSVCGRTLFATPIPGDLEIVQLMMAIAISCFLPWAQIQQSHVVVDFFTRSVSLAISQRLSRLANGLMTFIAALFAWRTAASTLSALTTNESSMILEIPIWLNYATLVPGFSTMALIAVTQTLWPRAAAIRHTTEAPPITS